MGVLALEIQPDPHYEEMFSFLSGEEAYWLHNDKWSADSEAYKSLNLGSIKEGRHIIANFSDYKNDHVKLEAKYAILLIMKPVYVLLRETGWRGTDILNLRYDDCLDYVWNSREEIYVPYLYGEITKTGIPILGKHIISKPTPCAIQGLWNIQSRECR